MTYMRRVVDLAYKAFQHEGHYQLILAPKTSSLDPWEIATLLARDFTSLLASSGAPQTFRWQLHE
jgi:hypothetical protein